MLRERSTLINNLHRFLDISLTVAAFVSAYFIKCVFRRNPPKWRVRVGVFGAASMNQQSSLKLPLPLKA